jgi:hypothetical protein
MELPEGWERKPFFFGDVLTWPDHGSVTVNVEKRGFAIGHGTYVRNMAGYTGRGWKDRLYADAVKALQAVWESEPVDAPLERAD